MSSSSSLSFEGIRREAPQPSVLPQAPSPYLTRQTLTLSQLTPGQYIDTIARVASIKVSEKQDQMGSRTVTTGMLEDRTFKVAYLSYKVSLPLALNSAFRFKSVYVHEFEDRSLLLILTEYSRAQPVEISSIKDFYWTPRIGTIARPVLDVSLNGIISGISDSSGLVKRCNECRRVIFGECPQGCKKGWDDPASGLS